MHEYKRRGNSRGIIQVVDKKTTNMNRLVLLFALVAVAHAAPKWNLLDIALETPVADLGANVGEDGVGLSLVPNKKVQSGLGSLIKGIGNVVGKGAEAVGNIGEGVAKGVANVVDGTGALVKEVGNGIGSGLGSLADGLRNDREEMKVDGENANSNAQEVADEVSTNLLPPTESNLNKPINDLANDGNSDSNAQEVAAEVSTSLVPPTESNLNKPINDLANDGNSDSNAQEVAAEVSTSLVPPTESNLNKPINDLANDGNSDSNVQGIEDDLSVSLIPVENGAAGGIGDLSNP
ncbi:uncharacterized protein LOC115447719 [Manduca sexta]|uniref:uncharacterized protein LOC115447719 n=1 Tax=Manduca sexta TaxID=7130 RepID=UPI001890861B|nr:uncharacterized protein LOC115447719 [Manduca sexta]